MLDTDRPIVTVVVPVFNAGSWIDQTIQCVQEQTLTDWELIIVDDCSDDKKGYEYLSTTYGSDPRINVLSTKKRSGVATARNLAIEAARGRYVAFLDADDLWRPKKLEIQLGQMQLCGATLSCTAYQRKNFETGKTIEVGVDEIITFKGLLKTNQIACSTAIFDKHAFPNSHMPLLHSRQDFAFWLDLLSSGAKAIGIPTVLMTYRLQRNSLSSNKMRAARATWHVYRNQLKFPTLVAAWYFSQYATRGFARHRTPNIARLLGWL